MSQRGSKMRAWQTVPRQGLVPEQSFGLQNGFLICAARCLERPVTPICCSKLSGISSVQRLAETNSRLNG